MVNMGTKSESFKLQDASEYIIHEFPVSLIYIQVYSEKDSLREIMRFGCSLFQLMHVRILLDVTVTKHVRTSLNLISESLITASYPIP